MSKQLVMKFRLQLRNLPKCLKRKCGKEGVLLKIKQNKPGRLIKLHGASREQVANLMNCLSLLQKDRVIGLFSAVRPEVGQKFSRWRQERDHSGIFDSFQFFMPLGPGPRESRPCIFSLSVCR